MNEMSVTAKVTEKDLFYFFVYHNYSRLSGKLTGALGVVSLIAAPIVIGQDLISGVLLAVLAISFLVQPLLSFFIRSRSLMKKNPIFRNETVFTVEKEGVLINQYQSSQTLKWDQLVKVSETKRMVLLYVDKMQAFLIPKSSFASLEDQVAFLNAIEDMRR
jgi:hypothetical protein